MPSAVLASPTAPCSGPLDAGEPLPAFLIPSVFGDEEQLRDLRERLRGTIAFDVLVLPDAGARGALLTDMAATGRLLVEEIGRRRPDGPVALVGYSFGASMALEVAAQLGDAGRPVAFLAALDGPFEPPRVAGATPVFPVLAGPRRLLKSLVVDAADSMPTMRRLVVGAAPSDPSAPARAEPMRRAMLWHLRNKALTGWTPRGCPAPGLHVSTGDYGPDNLALWARLCPNLETVDVCATHELLLRGESLDIVAAALVAAVRRTRMPARAAALAGAT